MGSHAESGSSNPPSTRPGVAAFVRNYAATHSFSGSIRIEEDGQAIFTGSFGLADRAFDIACSDDTGYWIASVTKMFTSVLILQLAQEKRIELDRPIQSYLPSYSGGGASSVKIRMLLNHTSGLPNADASYKDVFDAMDRGMPHYQLPSTPAQLIERFYSAKPTNEPGKVFDYNNADYIILGRIVESVTGKSFPDVLRERILTPLGMDATGLLHQREIIPRLAPCYFSPKKGGPLIHNMPVYPENWDAAGGMYSTTGDLMKFADAFYGGKLLSPSLVEQMLTPGLDGYGFGLWIGNPTFGGKAYRNVNRPGRIMGANASFYHFNGIGFDKTISIVILSNTDQTDLDQFSWEIGKTLLTP